MVRTSRHHDGPKRVLVIDDDHAVADGIAAILVIEGFEVEVVYTGTEAEEAAVHFRPDVVLLDLRLHDMNGVDVYECLAARWPNLPVIFSSGGTPPPSAAKFLSRPRVRFLAKPYDADVLLQTIEEIA
jgi:DNA-binding NtrC family response regulator